MATPGDVSKRAPKNSAKKMLARMNLPWLHSRRNARIDYQYTPLKDPLKETRIVILQPGRFNDEIRLSFEIRQLKNNFPAYEALSYVWGSQDNPSHARVIRNNASDNKEIIPIGRNLDIAIRHLRYEHRHRYFWIDALCINQQDITERSLQVSLMAKIYTQATLVTIWLGPEKNDSDKALDLLLFLSQKVIIGRSGHSLLPYQADEPEWADPDVALPYKDGELDPIAALFGRPYFRRVWVRQEIALAANALVKVGRKELSWEYFRTGAACIALKSHETDSVSEGLITTFIENLRFSIHPLCGKSKIMFGYSTLRETLQSAMCQDPRDRIFASLSILHAVDQKLGIIPDYSMTVQGLYIHVALQYYAIRRSLGLLSSCELSSRTLDIPSWVPDFSSRPEFLIPVESWWSACAWISAQHKSIGSGSISVAGVASAKVEQIIHLGHNERGWDDDSFRKTAKILYSLKPQKAVLPTRFDSEESYLEAYCRTFVLGRLGDLPEHRRTINLPDPAQCVKGLKFLWSSNESLWQDALLHYFPESFLNFCHQSFVGRCLIFASDDLFGLAPADTQEGDIITVLLGCRNPIVLRPIASSRSTPSWQVVGPCYVQGLMYGEAIYGARAARRIHAVVREDMDFEKKIDGYSFQLQDKTDKEKRWDNPAKALTELAGIKVEGYERYPHLLEVLPETLRAAGVALQEFTLI